VQYVGETVTIRELLGAYEILHQGVAIARHPALGRHQVAMERSHYATLLRPRGPTGDGPVPAPPRYDPAYPGAAAVAAVAEVAVRDLAVYAAIAEAAAERPAEEVGHES
jgi:hypothetical protein